MMKKFMVILSVIILIVCTVFPVIDAASRPYVRLPTGFVTMRATDGVTSYFDMRLSDIPSGFDIINGTYAAWCIQRSTIMARNVNHTVLLYSSYDPDMPLNFSNQNWTKVNYIINHKQGDRQSIQSVIWYYICNNPYPVNDTDAEAMIADANANGSNFIPEAGQKIGIIVDVVDGNYPNQRTFLELSLSSAVPPIGGLAWNDYNANGIQNTGEPGISGISVGLYTPNGSQVDTVLTDTHGLYSFGIFTAGEYYIQFSLPSGYRFSPEHQGSDDTKDSDVNPQTGRTIIMMIDPNNGSNTSWDAGLYQVNEQGNPPPPPVPGNHAPTADGTAGEPYRGIVGEEILFNGSRSYDIDGQIVSWQWSFGDGINASGVVVTHIYAKAGTYAVSLTVTDNDGATDTFHTTAQIRTPNQPPLKPSLSGPKEGNRNTSYVFDMVTTDPENDDVRYVVLWGDGSQDNSSFSSSGQSIQMSHKWSLLGFYIVRIYAVDPSNATSEENEFVMGIDVQYVGSLGYLINTDGVGPFDMFYSNQTGNTTVVRLTASGEYLIDINGDGIDEYKYNATSGSLQAYSGQQGFDTRYLMLFIGLVIVIILVIVLAFIGKRIKGKSQ
jgi:PKD repeat protein